MLGKFDDAIAMAISTIEKQTETDWAMPYSAEREPEAHGPLPGGARLCHAPVPSHRSDWFSFQGTQEILELSFPA